jgi:hypothetical protein
MDKEKHYPTHPGAEHPPIMTCEIPLEEYESLKRENEEIKAKLESVQASAYAESVDAGMENRRLKRALWLARTERAKETQFLWQVYCHCDKLYFCKPFCVTTRKNPYRYISRMNVVEWDEFWGKIKKKCLAKVKEYK